MRIDFITLFPEQVLGALQHSILARGCDQGLLEFNAVNPREFTSDRHRTVDDSPFGGGPGMVMLAEPIHQALLSAGLEPGTATVLLPDPTGFLFDQSDAIEFGALERIAIVCGHYEGIDDRLREHWNAIPLSIGDYVLTGGELPAAIIADAICRNVPGVLGSAESLEIDSFGEGLLSAPQYTRPEVWEGKSVPDVLRSGDHRAVEKFRRKTSLTVTRQRRADLFAKAHLSSGDLKLMVGDGPVGNSPRL